MKKSKVFLSLFTGLESVFILLLVYCYFTEVFGFQNDIISLLILGLNLLTAVPLIFMLKHFSKNEELGIQVSKLFKVSMIIMLCLNSIHNLLQLFLMGNDIFHPPHWHFG